MAVDMATALGFSDQTIAQMAENEYDKTILERTWSCLKILDTCLRSGEFNADGAPCALPLPSLN